MNNLSRPRRRFAWLLFFTLLLLAACRQPQEQTVVVTEVVEVAGERVLVTRLVRQVVEIPATVEVAQVPAQVADPVTLDISAQGSFPSLDPQRATTQESIDLIENLYVGLTRYDHRTDRVQPGLATDWEISPDGLTWTFHLRHDVYWVSQSGGSLRQVRPVVADDVVLGFRRACDPRTESAFAFALFFIPGCEEASRLLTATAADLDAIGVSAPDAHTVIIRLEEPANSLLAISSMWAFRPVPADQVTEMGKDWPARQAFWSSGPFVLLSGGEGDTRTVLGRNPLWPMDFPGNVDLVNIFHLNAETAFELWGEKGLDLAPVPADKEAEIVGELVPRYDLVPSQELFYLAYNFDSPTVGVPEVRRALGAAIDRERLVAEVYNGQALPVRHFAPTGVLGAPPTDEVGTGYNPDYARQQMAQSPFKSCRLLPAIRYLVNASDRALQQAELIREMWVEELGCDKSQIQIEQVQFGNLLASTRPDAGNSRPDVWELGWASYYPDENNWVGDVLHCQQSENRQRRPCSEVDDLITAAETTSSLDDRWATYRQIERLFFAQDGIEPLTPLYVRARYVMRQPWLTYTPASFGGEQYDTYIINWDDKQLERTP